MKTNDRIDVYQIVTDRMIALLEAGTVPWNKPWAGGDGIPKNLISGKPYRGINVWMLGCVSRYGSPYWLSYKQARDKGGTVRKGEKGSVAVFWKQLDVPDKDEADKTRRVMLLRYYSVFNVEQCDGVEYPKPAPVNPAFNPIEAAEAIVAGMPSPPKIEHVQARACYSRTDDSVNMPPRDTFTTEPEYYSTLFHELTHATGHESRLNRLQNSVSGFGSSSYAKEELVAEMGACFLSATAGIMHSTVDNSAAYIGNWIGRLKEDNKLVIVAASAAQRASDYILGKTFGEMVAAQ